jgi:hypothetical protein
LTDWNPPFEPEKADDEQAPMAPEAPNAPAAADAPAAPEAPTAAEEPLPPPTYESSMPLHSHEGSELGVEPQPLGEPPLGEDPTPPWIDPPVVEPVPVEAHDPPALPEHLHRPEAVIIGRGAVLPTEAPFQEVAFDIAPFDAEQREHLYARLVESNTAVRVEGTTLYGRIDDTQLIEGYIADLSGSEDIEEVIDEADQEDDEIVFELSSLSTEERRHLTMRLTGAGISHIWEVATDLVVSVGDAPMIERYIEEVRNPDGFGDEELAAFDEESDVDDEAVYAAMSNLYVAADKLMQRPGDDATAGEFYIAVDDVDGLPAPFGFDPRVWSQVQDLANKIADTLDAEGDTEVIGTDARTLRQLLANYV